MNEATTKCLAKIAHLPDDADLATFGAAVDDAIAKFLESGLDSNAVRRATAQLYSLADKVASGRIQFAVKLADEFRQMPERLRQDLAEREERLRARAQGTPSKIPGDPERLRRGACQRRFDPLPSPDELADPATAAEASERLCGYLTDGGSIKEGRKRPNGHRSRTSVPHLYAPAARKGRPGNAAADELAMWLAIAYCEATGRNPPRFCDRRKPGPFLRLVSEVLRMAQAPYIDAAETVRRYNEQRAAMEP